MGQDRMGWDWEGWDAIWDEMKRNGVKWDGAI